MIDRRSVLALVASAALSACATSGPAFGPANTSQLITANYTATDILASGSPRPIPKDAPIVVATLVRLDNHALSSNLGRLVSEQIASRLTQLGYAVPELKLRGSIFIRSNEGEMFLSRDVREIALSYHAQAIVVGTYAVGADVVYVHVELVDATTGHAISAYDYFLPMVSQVRVLLGLTPD
jgi:TolB-like protein